MSTTTDDVDWDARVLDFDEWIMSRGSEPVDFPDSGIDSGELLNAELHALAGASVRARQAVAEQYAIFARIVAEAIREPDVWVGPDPTLDPLWAGRRSVTVIRRERREFAERGAIADIAVRLRLSEPTVRARTARARTLIDRCPKVWAQFASGRVDQANADSMAETTMTLPDGAPELDEMFDAECVEAAVRLTPAKFRVFARALRERIHPEPLAERHTRARSQRGVWIDAQLDGMCTFTAVLSADAAHAGYARLDGMARALARETDETRTLSQLRADVLEDLLRDGVTDSLTHTSRPSVAVTVPVMTLLGQSDEPPTLDGYGPIDIDTARRLAGQAKSLVRILTHPVTGTVLDVDRKTYRVPQALRRWLGVRHPTCVFPGCRRAARDCDMDHRLEWHRGGRTAADELAPECESHHRVRHGTLWDIDTGSTTVTWTSPTGHVVEEDPPPF